MLSFCIVSAGSTCFVQPAFCSSSSSSSSVAIDLNEFLLVVVLGYVLIKVATKLIVAT